ncbi:GAF domain containing protein [Cryptosporidium ryanae]|uniref:GAF domain containing protein n=1 Tax=Cryptosporidium ryanae TaxID=515981 RepID=UPI00351A7C59|nr:GAF domain containing protein [Cryptosporidium ryanae]
MFEISSLRDKLSWDDLYHLLNSSYHINSTLDAKILVGNIINEFKKTANCRECNVYIYDSINDVFYKGFDTSNYLPPDPFLKNIILNNKHQVLNKNSPLGFICSSKNESDGGNYSNSFILNKCEHVNNALYLPLYSTDNKVSIAVLEVIDKKIEGDNEEFVYEQFNEIDILKLDLLAKIASNSIVNCEKYKEILNTKERADNLLNLVQSLRVDLGLQSNLFTLCIHAQEIIESEHCIALIGIPEKQQIISLISDIGSDLLFNYELGDVIHKIIETKHSLIIQNIGDDTNQHFENIFIESTTNSYKIGNYNSSIFINNNNDDQIIKLLHKVYRGDKPIYNALVFPIYAEKDNWSCIPTPSQRISSISSLSSVFSSFEISHDIDDITCSPKSGSVMSNSVIQSNIPTSPKSDRTGKASLNVNQSFNNNCNNNCNNNNNSSARSSSLSPSIHYIQGHTQAIALIVLINRLGVFKEKSKFTENDVKLLEPFGRIVAPNIGSIFQTSLFSYLQALYSSDRNSSLNKYQDKMPQDPPAFIFPHTNWKNRHSDIIFEEDEEVSKEFDK